MNFEATAPMASPPFGRPKPRLLDRVRLALHRSVDRPVTGAVPPREIDCKISQPNLSAPAG